MKLPVWFKGASIRRKLLSIIFLAIGAATLFTMILSTFLQWFALRDELVMNISSKVDIIASNVAGELNSNNREAAEKTLKALENIDSIEFAGILDVNGDSFALYVRPGYVMPAHQHPFGKGESHIHTATYIETAVPVHLNQEPLGLIRIRSDMSPVYRKLAWNIWITLIAAAGSIAVAVIILLRSLSAITKPLHRLVGVMAIVSRDNNFALRAELHGNDELGTLAKGFNGMLEQIQMRDNALGQKYTSLEADVAKRTVDLQESNRQLETELAERRAVQEELKNTNEELSILLDSLPIAVYRCRADDFSVLYMSKNVDSFTGYKPEDFIEEKDLWFSRIHPEDEPRISAEIATLFERGAYTTEYRWKRSDGTYLWLQDSLKLIRPEFGTTAYIVGMWQEITERKQAGEKLYESELAYRTLTRNLPGIVYRVFVREGNRMAFYNDMTIQLTGYKEDELSTGTVCSIEHLILDEDLPHLTAEVTAAIEEKRSFLVEYRLKHKNGTICWMSERGMPVFDEAGTLLYLDGMIFDITDGKETEEVIRRQQRLTSQIIEAIPLRIFWKDQDLHFLGCNTLFAKDAGLSCPDDLIGKSDFDMAWQDRAERYRSDDRLVMDSNTPKLSYDEPQSTPHGEEIWVRSSKVPLHNAVDETIGMLGVYDDITVSKQMEFSLLESEQRFRSIAELASDAVWQGDQQGVFVYFSEKVRDILGYEPEELIGKTPFDLMPPEEAVRFGGMIKGVTDDQKPFSFLENINIHKDGHRVVVEVSGLPMIDYDGIFQGYFGIIRDISERTEVARVLEESELKFRSILDTAPDGVLIVDMETNKFAIVNQAICDMLGYQREELYNLGIEDITPTEDLAHTQEQFELQAKGESKLGLDIVAKRKDGSVFFSDVSAAPLQVGEKHYMIGIIHDVTERKQAEETIRESETRNRAIFENADDIIYLLSPDGTFQSLNPSFERLTGWTPEEWIGKPFAGIIHPDDLPIANEVFHSALVEHVTRRFELRLARKSGGYRDYELNIVPLNPGGEIAVIGGARDITERKEVAQALEESELKFRSILDTAADGVAMVDAQTRKIVTVNRAICDMLGYEPEEMYELGVEDLHPAEALPDVLKQFERQMKGEMKLALNSQMKRKDGSVLFGDISAAPLTLGERHYSIGIFHDATERRQAEEEIRKVNEELEEKVTARTKQLLDAQEVLVRSEKLSVLGQVAGSVGHELRNPLGVMSNAVYFLQTVLPDADDSVKEYLGIIKNEITASERIVSDLLDSVRTKEPQPGIVSLAELIGQTLRKLEIPSSVVVKQEIPETLPLLMVDAQQIHQVLRNLISNGVEAMPEGGTLEIRAVADGTSEKITLGIHDNGVGMTPEQLGKLFQPLFTTKARGIGLGLIVVKNLIEANGGSVKVESEAGKGTLFTVTLPAANENGLSI